MASEKGNLWVGRNKNELENLKVIVILGKGIEISINCTFGQKNVILNEKK